MRILAFSQPLYRLPLFATPGGVDVDASMDAPRGVGRLLEAGIESGGGLAEAALMLLSREYT